MKQLTWGSAPQPIGLFPRLARRIGRIESALRTRRKSPPAAPRRTARPRSVSPLTTTCFFPSYAGVSGLIALVLALVLVAAHLAGCASITTAEPAPLYLPLPAPAPDSDSMFCIDKNINIDTIDAYLGRDDVAYVDLRMLFDPADFAAIGGDPDLTSTIKGFRIVPYPFIATLETLPVSGRYEGPCLYTLTWTERGAIESATPNYAESEMIINELFPKDKIIFLMCGGGGYSCMMKSLLLYLGWDRDLLYVIGKHWEYTGKNSIELIVHPEDPSGKITYAIWRADYVSIDFALLHEAAAL